MRKITGLILFIALALLGDSHANVYASPASATAAIRFAVVGDYGMAGQAEADVAALVESWNPDFIITVGDNNYLMGSTTTIDANIGQYYHSYIYPYTGNYGAGATTNKFFPIPGNHDWETPDAQPYVDYFKLPGNERYYDFVKGPIHFFALDSDPREPDGYTQTSTQGIWVENAIKNSTTPWQVVLAHHAPYSSGLHGSSAYMQWDFQAWGADAALSGHDHTYERIVLNGFPYFVNGLGGAEIYSFNTPVTGSMLRYNGDHGAMLIEATDTQITFRFYNRTGTLKDEYILKTTFADVAKNYWAWSSIEKLYNAHITTGCGTSPFIYCPTSPVTRSQMAVFLLRGIHGSTYSPPAPSGTIFGDVPANYWAAGWIEQLAAEGITSGCGNGNYCPDIAVTRDQMAVFLLRARHGRTYTPPLPKGTVFGDVPVTYWAAGWIEQLAGEGITGGCGGGNYCPTNSVTRDQMAVFLVKTFNLP